MSTKFTILLGSSPGVSSYILSEMSEYKEKYGYDNAMYLCFPEITKIKNLHFKDINKKDQIYQHSAEYNGAVVPRTDQENFDYIKFIVENYKNSEYITNIVICTHSEIIFTAIRLFVAEKILLKEQVEFIYYSLHLSNEEGEEKTLIEITDSGVIKNWPTKLFSLNYELTTEILKTRFKK